jgi:hypothetical protein
MADVLSSDILEQQFGPTTVEVLRQDEHARLICTKVIATGQVLEISSTTFIKAGANEFPAVHQAVLDGQSMGKAFRAAGVDFVRQTKTTYKRIPAPEFADWFASNKPATVVEVTILVGPHKTPYATILETYSAAVHWPDSVM